MQLSLFDVVLLAIVQGLTEFLPISSSGHLVVLAAFLSPDGTAEGLDVADVNIVLHGGTLGSILVVYWHRIRQLLTRDRRTIGLLIWGTLPAVVVGVPLKKYASDTVLGNPLLAGCMLIATGVMLLWVARLPRGTKPYQELTTLQALLIGLGQAAAILPGLSRAGTTIAAGMRLGLPPTSAATFSFLLAIPAIAGACVLELASSVAESRTTNASSVATTPESVLENVSESISPLPSETTPSARSASTPPPTTPASYLAIGALISFLVGLGALHWLLRWIEGNRLPYFAWWCIPLGTTVLIWQLSAT